MNINKRMNIFIIFSIIISSHSVELSEIRIFEIRESFALVQLLLGAKYFDHSDMGVLAAVLVLQNAYLNIHCQDVIFLVDVV